METNTLDVDTFKWTCHDGREMRPAKMQTTHLFYSVRMVFNALVPKEHRIEGKVWMLSPHRPPGYWRQALIIMLQELSTRHDLPTYMMHQLFQMQLSVKQLTTLQITKTII